MGARHTLVGARGPAGPVLEKLEAMLWVASFVAGPAARGVLQQGRALLAPSLLLLRGREDWWLG